MTDNERAVLCEFGYRQLLWLIAEGICTLPTERRDYLLDIKYPFLLDERVITDLQYFVGVITAEQDADKFGRRAAA